MTRKPDPLHNLADALSEEIVAAPADVLVHDAAGEPGGADALVASFDRIAARAATQSRRRRLVERLRALAHVWPGPIGWTSVLAGVAGIFVMVIAGGLYFHQSGAYQPVAAPPPVVAEPIAQTPPPARDNGPTARAVEPPAITDRLARTDHAAAAAPPPAPAAAAGVADEPMRAHTLEVRPGAVAPEPSTRAAPLQPPAEDRLAVLAMTAEQKRSIAPSPAPPAAFAPATRSSAPAAPASAAVIGDVADAPPAFLWPLRGRVIAGFGSSVGGAPNRGIDLAVAAGTDIRAAEDGVVLYAGNEIEDFGNLLLLRHRDGFLTAYAHAQSFAVKPGDTVRRGQVIAKSGRSGGRPQLHFEIRKDDAPVDPAQYLPPNN